MLRIVQICQLTPAGRLIEGRQRMLITQLMQLGQGEPSAAFARADVGGDLGGDREAGGGVDRILGVELAQRRAVLQGGL